MKKSIQIALGIILMTGLPIFTLAQKTVTKEDYQRAEKLLGTSTSKLVYDVNFRLSWIDGNRFWYRKYSPKGNEFLLVDIAKQKISPAFDHAKVAASLSQLRSEKYTAYDLPFFSFQYGEDEKSIEFNIRGKQYQCAVGTGVCEETKPKVLRKRNSIESPDGKKAAFIKDYNLWVQDLETGNETQLTTDGIKDYGYATNNAGWVKSDRPVLLWSPDSKMIATFQHDARGVGDMYLVSTNVGHPKLEAWKYPLPEDTVIFRIHRVVIHLDGPKVVRLKMEPDMHRSTNADHIVFRGQYADIEWSEDASQLYFVSTSRDHKHETLRVADPQTGDVRDVLSESVETFFESGVGMRNWHVLKNSNEVIWYSERDNWGHLYLYDLQSGQLKHQITKGNWLVTQVLHIDQNNRAIYFEGAGREEGNPYYQYLYKVGIDNGGESIQLEKGSESSGVQMLSPENSNHVISMSPSGEYFIDGYSTPVDPPVRIIRDKNGKKIMDLEKADISKLRASGWQPPEQFSVKARDGKTDLYGLMWKPSNFDPNKKYPIINYIYPGPQSASVGTRSFTPSRGDRQSLAELGFIVVALDAMGTPMRSKSFHEAYYGNMGDNGLPDQIAGMKQLAEKYPWIDIDKAGIYGHSGGGFASTDAILRYPDFFKVAVSGAGNHDNRNYEDDWGEKWQGLLTTNPDGSTSYDNQANENLAKNLKGKLLLCHGTMDTNVPPYNTLLVVNQLIEANKDFDLVLFPNRGHGFAYEPYMLRIRWDYFVRNLMGAEPPKEYEFGKLNN